MDSLQYDTPKLMARFAAPSTMAEEIFRLRESVQKLQVELACYTSVVWLKRVLDERNSLKARVEKHEVEIATTIAAAERDIYAACARASCRLCAEGYTVLRSSAVGQFAHFADLQPKDLPPIYFDQVCYATHIWALAEDKSESQPNAPQAQA